MSCKNVYVMGPSGAGKGTLIDRIMAYCGGNEIGNFVTANSIAHNDPSFLRAKGNLSRVIAYFLEGSSSIDQVQLAWVDYFMQRDHSVRDTYLNNLDVDASNMVMLWDRGIVEVDDYNDAYCHAGVMDGCVGEAILDLVLHHTFAPKYKILKAEKVIYLLPDEDELMRRLKSRDRKWDRWAIENDVVHELYLEYGKDIDYTSGRAGDDRLMVIEDGYDVGEVVGWILDR